MAEYLLLSIEDRVATVTINRPDKGNSLSPEVLAEIEETFNGLSENAEVNVVVLTGGEKIFSAGFDLDYIKTIEKVSNEEFTPLFHAAYRSIMFCRQPVIAAVGGAAIAGGFDLTLEVWLRTPAMSAPVRLSRGSFGGMYWTMAQLVAHHASNGCNLEPGDLLASGTVSGETKESRGSLLELTWGGKEPLTLPNGEQRTFLEDGDEVIFRAYCEREGYARIGFGECRGVVLPAT